MRAVSLGICDYTGNWQATSANHWRWSASPDETTLLLLTTMVSSSILNFSVGLGAVRLMLYDCFIINMVDFQSSNVDGRVDNDLLNLCSMLLTIIVRLVLNIKKTATGYMNNMLIHYPVHCLAYCPINVLTVFILCYVIGHFAPIKYYYLCIVAHFKLKMKCFNYFSCYIIDSLIYYLLTFTNLFRLLPSRWCRRFSP